MRPEPAEEELRLVEVFLPHSSDVSHDELRDAMIEYGFDDETSYYEDSWSNDGRYYLKFTSSGHERDSSGDQVLIYERY
jgi:hypothetical protein